MSTKEIYLDDGRDFEGDIEFSGLFSPEQERRFQQGGSFNIFLRNVVVTSLEIKHFQKDVKTVISIKKIKEEL